jgi:hypothetical protein
VRSAGTVRSAPRLMANPRNDVYKEWVEFHPRMARRALTLAPARPFGGAANTSRKRIEIKANLLFLLVPGRGI